MGGGDISAFEALRLLAPPSPLPIPSVSLINHVQSTSPGMRHHTLILTFVVL